MAVNLTDDSSKKTLCKRYLYVVAPHGYGLPVERVGLLQPAVVLGDEVSVGPTVAAMVRRRVMVGVNVAVA